MSDSTVSTGQSQVADKGLVARLVGVIVSPAETFRSIVAKPRWLGALAVILVLLTGMQFTFLSTKVGQDAMLDQQIKQAEAWGGSMTPEAQQRAEGMLPMMRYIVGGSTLVFGTIMTFIVAGILFAVFTAMMGGEGTYKQVLAVVTHAGAVNVLQMAFTVPLNYLRETMTSATNLGVFLPFLEEGSLGARFFGMLDLFVFWYLFVLAVGFAVLYRRRTGSIFVSFMGVYVVIVALVAVIMRVVAGSH